MVLLGLVVRHQTTPATALGLQWLRCVSRVGLQPMYDFLGFVLDLFPSSLPLPSGSVAHLDHLEYDFVLEEFRPGGIADKGWEPPRAALKLQSKAHPPRAGGGAAPAPEPPAEPPPTPRVSLKSAVLDAATQLRGGTAPSQPGPAATSVAEDAPPCEDDEDEDTLPGIEEPEVPALEPGPRRAGGRGDLTRLLEGSRELIYRPTTVETILGPLRSRGVVHSLGRKALLLAVPGTEVFQGRELVVRFPVPVRGRKAVVDLRCAVEKASRMEGRDAVAYDLRILFAESEPAPGLWERWVRHLFERRSFQG